MKSVYETHPKVPPNGSDLFGVRFESTSRMMDNPQGTNRKPVRFSGQLE